MAIDAQPRPSRWSRILAVGFYLGLAPFLKLLRLGNGDPHVQHHSRQALVLLLVPWTMLLVALGGLAYSTYLLVYRPEVFSNSTTTPAGVIATYAFAGVFWVWLLVWLLGVVFAITGSRRPIPTVARIAKGKTWVLVSLVSNSLLWVGAFLMLAAAWHTASLIRSGGGPAPVYVLHDDRPFETVPLWVRNLRFYRIALAATDKWGPGSIVVASLTEDNLKQALRHGRFVVLWGHGIQGELVTTEDLLLYPQGKAKVLIHTPDWSRIDWLSVDTTRVQVVYLTGCQGGAKAKEWAQTFSPAEVSAFDRYTGGMEHILWAWFSAPNRLRALE